MPMHQRASAALVGEIDAKTFAGREANTRTSVRPDEPEDPGRPAIHVEHPRPGNKALRSNRCGARCRRQHTGGEGSPEKTAAGDGRAHGRPPYVMPA